MPVVSHRTLWECPACEFRQYVDFGILDDFTIPDIEAIRCYSCKFLELVDEEEFHVNYFEEDNFGNVTDIKTSQENIEKHCQIEEGSAL